MKPTRTLTPLNRFRRTFWIAFWRAVDETHPEGWKLFLRMLLAVAAIFAAGMIIEGVWS